MSADHENHGLWLPGYTLSTKLGAGGYGEVWLAHAPGGLTKAVKFIFGSYHEKRAEHELKALQKVKEVRHPFLLSLERIEVVDGRLVIVTELADASLKDRFDECVQQGLPGVPRDELLGYLRDAADALDFLSQKHRLQHLDIKPENLLLVGGHVKVADFGLIKDVGKSQASLVGGLTPLYSAPEVFQGSPSSFSDQYSLAVLYQEMLTGVLPFSGVTAAELTLQHLNDDPDLSPVPDVDRYILSQGLAKDPTQRFESCSAMIAALLSRRDERPGGWAAPAEAPQPAVVVAPVERRCRPITELFGEQLDGVAKELSKSMLLETPPLADPQPRALAPIEAPADALAAQPTLVIGIGGAAGDVLKQFRLRTVRQFGDERLQAVQLLLLDSDPKSIAKALTGDARAALRPEETLALSLRRPQEYREQSARLMRWLSRRWLYNIPRSLRTDGMRPLGRLAFADHARQVVQRIRVSLAHATAAEAIEQSQLRTGMAFGGAAPRVYVIASISGGAGSGMSLDVGYAVRAALDKAGAAEASIIGIFIHASGSDPRHCDLAKVNSYAWLTEYNHFHRPGGQFPGDDSCGLPALPAGRRAFDSAYLVNADMAEEAEETFDAAASIAEYMFLDALTPAQSFFNVCRRDESRSLAAAPLRTFAVHSFTATPDSAVDRGAAALAREVVLGWTGGSGSTSKVSLGASAAAKLTSETGAPRDTNQIVQGAATLVAQLQLKFDAFASNARALVEGQFGDDLQAFLTDLFAAVGPSAKATNLLDMVRAIDRLFAPPPGEAPTGAYVMQQPLDAIVGPLCMKLAGDLSQWILRKIDDRQERLAGAQRASQWLVEHLKSVEAHAVQMGEGLARQLSTTSEELRRDPRAARAEGSKALAKATGYFRMRIDNAAMGAATLVVRRLQAELKSVNGTIAEFGRHMKHLVASFPESGESDAAAGDNDPLKSALAANMRTLAKEIDGQIQEQFISDLGGLFPAIMGNSRVRAQMLSTLGKLARQAVEKLAARPDVMNAALSTLSPGKAADATDGDELPPLLGLGGMYRKLAVVPTEAAGGRPIQHWRDELGDDASIVAAASSEVATVFEGWRLPLVHLSVSLIQSRRDYADFAARVHTRCDVPWLPLVASTASQTILADSFADLIPGVDGGAAIGNVGGLAGIGDLGNDAPSMPQLM